MHLFLKNPKGFITCKVTPPSTEQSNTDKKNGWQHRERLLQNHQTGILSESTTALREHDYSVFRDVGRQCYGPHVTKEQMEKAGKRMKTKVAAGTH